MEYYLYLNLLKKSEEHTLLGKFLYTEEEEDWYHRKLLRFLLSVFCYVLKSIKLTYYNLNLQLMTIMMPIALDEHCLCCHGSTAFPISRSRGGSTKIWKKCCLNYERKLHRIKIVQNKSFLSPCPFLFFLFNLIVLFLNISKVLG